LAKYVDMNGIIYNIYTQKWQPWGLHFFRFGLQVT